MPASAAGDFLRTQRDVATGLATVAGDASAIITVSGPDRLTWLNSLITQEVLGLKPGHTVESLVLSPQGRVEHAFLLADDGLTTWMLTDIESSAALETWLVSMKFRMDVTIDRPENFQILVSPLESVFSEHAPLMVFSDPWPRVGSGSVGYAQDPHPGEDWTLVNGVFPADHAAGIPGPIVSPSHLDALSIAAARPTMADVDEKTLPHELDWLRTAVHLNKGCYRGQETVAKVHNLGHPPRRFTLLHLDGSESLLPAAGDKLVLGDKEVGIVKRAAWHYEMGPIALALVKRTTAGDAVLTVRTGGRFVGASQEVLVPPDAGATRNVPRLGRLR